MSFIFAFLAGVLSILSPCVLPLLPLILGATISKHRYGLFALTAGLALSFMILGLFVATIGFSLGIDQDVFRVVAAVILALMGILMLLPPSSLLSNISAWFENRFASKTGDGLVGQFLTGVLLGIIWVPCVGPTLGAASILAAKGENLAEVAGIMLVFGIGAALPLLIIGLFAVKNLRFLATGIDRAKKVFAVILILTALFILTGLDKKLSSFLIEISPAWLTKLSTLY